MNLVRRALCAATIVFAAAGSSWAQSSIVMASTTSTEQSGLFGHLLPEFTKATGITVKVVAVGTGQAIDMARLINGEVRVIATGGGAFMDPRTRQLLNERAITVWLDAPIDVLAERTTRRDNRPLLKKGNRSEILARLSDERRDGYAEAQIHIRSGGGAHGDVVDSIVAALRERFGG